MQQSPAEKKIFPAGISRVFGIDTHKFDYICISLWNIVPQLQKWLKVNPQKMDNFRQKAAATL